MRAARRARCAGNAGRRARARARRRRSRRAAARHRRAAALQLPCDGRGTVPAQARARPGGRGSIRGSPASWTTARAAADRSGSGWGCAGQGGRRSSPSECLKRRYQYGATSGSTGQEPSGHDRYDCDTGRDEAEAAAALGRRGDGLAARHPARGVGDVVPPDHAGRPSAWTGCRPCGPGSGLRAHRRASPAPPGTGPPCS